VLNILRALARLSARLVGLYQGISSPMSDPVEVLDFHEALARLARQVSDLIDSQARMRARLDRIEKLQPDRLSLPGAYEERGSKQGESK
jgi:hypothetical protein